MIWFEDWPQAWREAFEGWIASQRGAGTRGDYRRIGELFFRRCRKQPQEVQASDVRHWQAGLRRKHYAASTIRTYLNTLRSFYQYAAGQGLREDNPVEAERLAKTTAAGGGRCLSQEEQKRLLEAVDRETAWGKRDYALILFLLRSGRWAGEAAGLRWGDFEVRKEGVWYRWRKGRGSAGKAPAADAETGQGAGGVYHRTKLDWEAWAAICSYLEGCGRLETMREEEAIFTPLTDATGRVERLYGEGWREHSLRGSNLGRQIKMYARWAELDEGAVSPKVLRNTAAKNMLRQGLSLEALQERLGYSQLSATRALVKGLQAEGADSRTPYHSQRRKRGGTIGNRNAAELDNFILELLRKEGITEAIPRRGAVRVELYILRLTILKLLTISRKVRELDKAVKILDMLGRACMRVARLVEIEHALNGFRPLKREDWLEQRFEELLREERERGF